MANLDFGNKEEVAELIEENLFTVYREIAWEFEFDFHQIAFETCWVIKENIAWPRMFFGPADDSIIASALPSIENKKAPPTWILRSEDSDLTEIAFQNNGFKKVKIWPGMALDLKGFSNSDPKLDCKLQEEDLESWLEVVNTVFFTKDPFTSDYIQSLFHSELPITFYGLKKEGELVAIALTFQNEEYINLFMVATLPAFRKKGYSSQLINQILVDAKKSNCDAAFLQATPKAVPMYNKIGFNTFCNFDLYWFLNGHK